MQVIRFIVVVLCLATVSSLEVRAQGTAFSHQGFLTEAGESANGVYDLHFTVFDAASGGTAQAASNLVTALPISNGLFTVTLDYGTNVFTGAARWLETAVRTNGADTFTTLSPRQPLLPAPYAMHAGRMAVTGLVGTISSVQLGSSVISNSHLATPVQTNITARLASNTWAAADATTNYVRRTGDTMSGALTLPDGGLSVGTTQFVVTEAGGVGVGVALPTAGLQISNSVSFDTVRLSSGHSGGTWLNLENMFGGRSWGFVSAGSGNAEGAGNLLVRDNALGSVRMILLTNGNVGVGTLTPGAAFHVAGNEIVSGVVTASAFSGSGAQLTSISGGQLTAGTVSNAHLSTAVQTNITARLASNTWAAADATTNYVRRTGDTLSGALNLPAGGLNIGSTQLVMDAAGNVGLGTTNTAERLSLQGNAFFTRDADRSLYVGMEPDNTTDARSLTITAGAASTSGVPFQARKGGDLILAAGNAYNANIAGKDGGDVIIRSGANWYSGTTDPGGDIVFQTGYITNSFIERMRIQESGDVGIGTTNPLAALHVAGNVLVSGVVTASAFSGSGGQLTPGTISNVHFATEAQTNIAARLASNAWAVADATTNYVRRTGDAMSGTLSLPEDGLILGAAPLGGTAGSAVAALTHQLTLGGNYNFGPNSGGVKLWIGDYDNDGTTNYPIYVEDENNLVDFWIKSRTNQTTAKPQLYFAGDVGIGTTNPAYALDVNGAIGASSFVGSGSGLTAIPGSALVSGSVSNTQLSTAVQTNISARLASNTWAAADATTNYVRRTGDGMTGSLGIGTNAPGAALHVVGNQIVSGVVTATAFFGSGAALSGITVTNTIITNKVDKTGDTMTGLLTISTSGNSVLSLVSSHTLGTWESLQNTSSGGTTHDIISTGSGNGEGPGKLLFRRGGSVVMTISTNNGLGIGTVNPTGLLHVAGNAYATAWLNSSDRNAKERIADVDVQDILARIMAMPVSQWSFKTESGVRHIGPMAQDFHAAFGLGPSDTAIATVDADGVALAAIQGLKKEKDAEIEALRKRNDALEREIAELRSLIEKIATPTK